MLSGARMLKGRPMITIECLRMQTPQTPGNGPESSLWALVRQELDKLQPEQGRIATRIDQPGEVMVLLRWEQEHFDPRGSRVALALVSELRQYGLVNYSAWVEGPNLPSASSRTLTKGVVI